MQVTRVKVSINQVVNKTWLQKEVTKVEAGSSRSAFLNGANMLNVWDWLF